VRVLDVGGTPGFWEQYYQELPQNVHIVLVNLSFKTRSDLDWIQTTIGDARSMPMFADRSFDFSFSNSVIEHVGSREDQVRMANEMRRVANGYYVQTPNLYFPLEPHFLVPFWQFLPRHIRAHLLHRRGWGWIPKAPTLSAAREAVESISLLSERDMRSLFPDGEIYLEKMGPLIKSIIAWRKPVTNIVLADSSNRTSVPHEYSDRENRRAPSV
jgi:hypothetical protein